MTTPLQALELAKRLRALWEHLQHRPLTHADEQDLRTIREAAAFLEHPVNTGQGDWQWISGALSAALEKQSSRDIAKETGLGHATVCRIANGHEPSVSSYFALARWLKPSLAARTPLASVEGEWCPDWTLSDQDKTAVALTLALSKHIPDWPGATDDQLADVAKAVLSALAQSGRSSAEPVAHRVRFRQKTNDGWTKWSTWRLGINVPASTSQIEFEGQALYLSPPVGPQEAVAVKPLVWATATYGWYSGIYNVKPQGDNGWYLVIAGGREKGIWSTPDEAKAAAQAHFNATILSALSPSSIDLGGEVEMLTVGALQELRKHVFLGSRSSDIRRAVRIIEDALSAAGYSNANV